MIINHNMNALNAHRMMSGNTISSGKSMEKLSSGLRINRAGDDAAGLAISEKMRGQIRGLDQAARNSQDGISMIQTAEGALNETHSILQRMRELATQASNDTNNGNDRSQIQNEIDQLTSEINRIGNTTEFNTQKVLDGGENARKTATSTSVKEAVTLTATAAVAGKGTAAKAAEQTADADLGSSVAFDTATKIALAGKDVALTNVKTLGTAYDAKANKADVVAALQKDIDSVADLKDKFKVSTSGDKLVITTVETGAAAEVNLTGSDVGTGATLLGFTTLASNKGAAASADYQAAVPAGDQFTVAAPEAGKQYTYSIGGEDLKVEGADAKAIATSLKAAIEGNAKLKDNYTVTVADDKVTLVKTAANTSTDALKVDVTKSDADSKQFTATLQIGANKGQAFKIDINDMRSVALGISKAGETAIEGKDVALTATAAVAGKGTAAKAAEQTADADLGSSVAFDTATKIALAGKDVALTNVKALGTAYDAKANKADVVAALQKDIDSVADLKDKFKVSTSGDKLVITTVETGAAAEVNLTGSDVGTGATLLGFTTLASNKGAAASADYQAAVPAGDQFTVAAPEAGKQYTYSIGGEDLKVEGADAKAMATSLKAAIEGNAKLKDNYTVTVADDKVTLVKTAANTSTDALKVQVKEQNASEAAFTKEGKVTNGTDSKTVESALDISTHDNATNAIDVIQKAIDMVSTERSKLGAFQNRLEHTINNLGTSSENLTAAESRIRDVDMAKEMMTFSKNNILAQAAQAMLAQANQQPQGVLQLLR